MKIRIDRWLSNMGKGSRSDIKSAVRAGRIRRNDVVIKSASELAIVGQDVVTFDGIEVPYIENLYLMLNKPEGCISATEDNFHQTVLDLIGQEYAHYDLFPVGRLDIDTTGLLILTTDGELAHEILSPRRGVPKKYIAKLDKEISYDEMAVIAAGPTISLRGGKHHCLAAEIERLGDRYYEIVIYEGKFHQVKKMFEVVGAEVLTLKRVSIATLELDPELELGAYREITEEELNRLIQEIRS